MSEYVSNKNMVVFWLEDYILMKYVNKLYYGFFNAQTCINRLLLFFIWVIPFEINPTKGKISKEIAKNTIWC